MWAHEREWLWYPTTEDETRRSFGPKKIVAYGQRRRRRHRRRRHRLLHLPRASSCVGQRKSCVPTLRQDNFLANVTMRTSVGVVVIFLRTSNVDFVTTFWSTFEGSSLAYSLARMDGHANQCDQIGRFIALWAIFKACGNNYLAQIILIIGKFYKGVKIFNFSCEIIFGRLFTGHADTNQPKYVDRTQ